MQRPDVIAVVEAAYQLSGTDQEWIDTLVECVDSVLSRGTGVIGYRYTYDGPSVRADLHTCSDAVPEQAFQGSLDLAEWLQKPSHPNHGKALQTMSVYRNQTAGAILASEFTYGPLGKQAATLVSGIADVLYLNAEALDGSGSLVFATGLLQPETISYAERVLFHQLGAHLKTAFRLRGWSTVGEEAAILDAAGRVLHAEGDAREAIATLEEAAVRIDKARTKQSGRHAEALAAWEGLIDGRWSLVERFDTDGKRLLIAHENPSGVRDPRGLTRREKDVVALAVQGYADKLIAYHLGIAEGTVSAHLSRAMRKLLVENRIQLIRLLAGRIESPQSEELES